MIYGCIEIVYFRRSKTLIGVGLLIKTTNINIYDKLILMCIQTLKTRLELFKTDRGYGPSYSQWQGSQWGI